MTNKNKITFLDGLYPRFNARHYNGIVVVAGTPAKYDQCPVVCRCNFTQDIIWSAVAQYGITKYFLNGKKVIKETFLEFVATNYPADFEMILWHPEILNGQYDVG